METKREREIWECKRKMGEKKSHHPPLQHTNLQKVFLQVWDLSAYIIFCEKNVN
jgi:hypothetical protein